ncbi:MAG: maleylacetate reductase [Gemmatimonadota bacterium]|nr:maleylacetate reductase [Gemmatimonadota bacterium]
MRFTFDALPTRVVFGAGCFSQLAEEVDRLEAKAVLLVGSRGRANLLERAKELLGERIAGTFDEAVMHVPAEVAERARHQAETTLADSIVCIGGGSSIGVAKAVAVTTSLPIVAVPTTYSGSEVTPIWGLTKDGIKETGRHARAQPRTVIYDPELTLKLPVSVSAASGMNAIAHCVEAMYAADGNPVTALMAEEGIRSLASALPLLVTAPEDLAARTLALHGAWMGGTVLGMVQMGLHHKLCHTLGGSFDLPHAETHAVLLAYTAEYNAPAAAEAMSRIAGALGASDAPADLFELGRRLPVPRSLAELGIREEDLERAAAIAVERPYPNPRPVTREGVLSILRKAFVGDAIKSTR